MTLRTTRFHFADAAAQAYLNTRVGDSGVREFLGELSAVLNALNLALFQIVDRFVLRRGFAYRPGPAPRAPQMGARPART